MRTRWCNMKHAIYNIVIGLIAISFKKGLDNPYSIEYSLEATSSFFELLHELQLTDSLLSEALTGKLNCLGQFIGMTRRPS